MSIAEWLQIAALIVIAWALGIGAGVATASTGYGLPVGGLVGGLSLLAVAALIERHLRGTR